MKPWMPRTNTIAAPPNSGPGSRLRRSGTRCRRRRGRRPRASRRFPASRRSTGSAAARSPPARGARAASAAAASSGTSPASARAERRPRRRCAPESTSAFVNFCLPIVPSIGSNASRRYALNAQPKSETAAPVKRRSMALISLDGSVRPTGHAARPCRPLATSAPPSIAATSFRMSSGASGDLRPSSRRRRLVRVQSRRASRDAGRKLRRKRTAHTRRSAACRRSSSAASCR